MARSFRLAARLHRRISRLSKILLGRVAHVISSDAGLVPRARRDVARALDRGGVEIDPDAAYVVAVGAAIALGQYIHLRPDVDDAALADRVTALLLAMLGLGRSEADEVVARALRAVDLPLPLSEQAATANNVRRNRQMGLTPPG